MLFCKCEKNMDGIDEYGRTIKNTDFQKTTNMDGIWTEYGLKLDGVSVTFIPFIKKTIRIIFPFKHVVIYLTNSL